MYFNGISFILCLSEILEFKNHRNTSHEPARINSLISVEKITLFSENMILGLVLWLFGSFLVN